MTAFDDALVALLRAGTAKPDRFEVCRVHKTPVWSQGRIAQDRISFCPACIKNRPARREP